MFIGQPHDSDELGTYRLTSSLGRSQSATDLIVVVVVHVVSFISNRTQQ